MHVCVAVHVRLTVQMGDPCIVDHPHSFGSHLRVRRLRSIDERSELGSIHLILCGQVFPRVHRFSEVADGINEGQSVLSQVFSSRSRTIKHGMPHARVAFLDHVHRT
jgi:hypothetical protein